MYDRFRRYAFWQSRRDDISSSKIDFTGFADCYLSILACDNRGGLVPFYAARTVTVCIQLEAITFGMVLL